MKKYYNILILIAAFTGFLAVQLTFDLVDLSAEPSSVENLEFGHINSAFKETTILTLKGDEYSLRNIQSPVIVLIFWASWCAPCLQELPWFQDIYEEHKTDKLTLIAINVDEKRNASKVYDVIRRYGLEFPMVTDYDGKISSKFLVESLPTTLIFKNNKIVEIISDTSQLDKVSLKQKISDIID